MKNPSLAITVCHHSASLVMPIGDPLDGFFYSTLKLTMGSKISGHAHFTFETQLKQIDVLRVSFKTNDLAFKEKYYTNKLNTYQHARIQKICPRGPSLTTFFSFF